MPTSVERRLELGKLVRERYTALKGEEKDPIVDGIGQLLRLAMSPNAPMQKVLSEAAKLIHRNFEFQYVSVAIKDAKDEKFRYVVAVGLTPSAEAAYKEIRYGVADIFDESAFPSTKISPSTHFYMSEDSPYKPGEELSYARPNQLSAVRQNPDDMLEGDYIDVFMLGYVRDIVGYIELSGTRSEKLPTRTTIRWVELIASLISTIEIHRGGWKL